MITFTKVALPYGWLGNMAPFAVVEGDLRWRTAEALFQAKRFVPDSAAFCAIYDATSPFAAKLIAKQHRAAMIIAPRSAADVSNMRAVLEAKIQQHPGLRALLLDTGEEQIIEDVSARPHAASLFWGMRRQGASWQGQNKLGELWMTLREELRR